MAAIGRFQKGESIFFAKVVDGEIYPLRGDVFGSPSYEKKPMKLKGVRTLTPVTPSKIIAVGLNYADHARESGKPVPKQPLFWIKATTSIIPDGGKIEVPFAHQSAHLQLFSTGQFHFDQYDLASRRHHSYRHSEWRWPDRVR